MRIELDGTTPLLNEWQRMHWRERKRCMESLAWRLAAARPPASGPVQSCVILIERRTRSGPRPDWDGLYGALKPILDCLVMPTRRNPHGLGVIADDSPDVVRWLGVIPGRGPTSTVIDILPAGDLRAVMERVVQAVERGTEMGDTR